MGRVPIHSTGPVNALNASLCSIYKLGLQTSNDSLTSTLTLTPSFSFFSPINEARRMNPLHLEPFHRPTLFERQQVLAQVEGNNNSIQDIDAEIRALIQRRQKFQQDNAFCQSVLAPVRRLTFDVLAHLFDHYVHSYEGDPWIVAHVNRTWRSAAFVTPSLWTGIHLELDPVAPTIPHSRRLGGREYCASVRQLELALYRPSNNLLHIKLASPPTLPHVVRAHIPSMLHLVSQRMDRWASLDIDGAISHLPGLNTQPFDNLEKLVMRTRDTSLLSLINKTATRLRSLTTTQLGLENFEDAEWWPTLRDLDVTIPIDQSLRPQTQILTRVLTRAVSLESLVLDFHQIQPGCTALAVLPNLRRLALFDIPQLLPFECPNLTHLQISVGKRRPITSPAPLPTPSTPIYLPHLTHLTFQHPNLAALSAIIAPDLVELVISPQVRIIAPQVNDNALRSIWNAERRQKGTMLSPRVLHLEDLHVSAETVQNVLELLDDLQELSIKWVRTDHASMFNSLSASTARERSAKHPAGGNRPLICPNLSKLYFYDSSTLRSEDTLSMQYSLQEVVRVRRELGHPLKSVICRWPNGNEMEEIRI